MTGGKKRGGRGTLRQRSILIMQPVRAHGHQLTVPSGLPLLEVVKILWQRNRLLLALRCGPRNRRHVGAKRIPVLVPPLGRSKGER